MLRRASYPEVWASPGYPEMPNVRTIVGDVIHRTLQRLLGALVKNACAGIDDPRAVATLRELGGYTRVLSSVVDERLAELGSNPRLDHRRASIERTVRERMPEMRERVQATVSRSELVLSGVRAAPSPSDTKGLSDGSYAELELRAPDLQWAGRADLVTLSPSGIRITDYKTGAPSPDHAQQLRIYALLWARDPRHNPHGRLASDLVISYPAEEMRVLPPTGDDLIELAEELKTRREDALQALAGRPPVARPSTEGCRHCSVRHLCETYWVFIDEPRAGTDGGGMPFIDAQVLISHRNGPRSWVCTIEHPAHLAERTVLIRTTDDGDVAPGRSLRVLSAAAEEDAEHDVLALTLTSASEVFRLTH